ncbi:MAG: DUF2177 family protein [Candidatus Altimarinota bacterium]
MIILKYFLTFLAGFFTLLILDYIWLGSVTKDFIIREFGNMVTVQDGKITINIFAGILAWISIALLVVVFVSTKYTNVKDVLFYSALIGFLSYSMYDLTNLTFLNNYSLKFTIVDIAWGTFACSMVGLTSYLVFSNFPK